jgi:hypothetical protein
MAGNKQLSIDLQLKLNQIRTQAKEVEQLLKQALSGGTSGNTSALATASSQADKLTVKLKMLQEAQRQLASTPGMSAELSKVDAEIAGVISSQRKLTTDTSTYVNLLKQEVQLREQSKNLASQTKNGASGGSSGGGGGGGLPGGLGGAAGGGGAGFLDMAAMTASTAALGALAAIAYKAVDGIEKMTEQAIKDAQNVSDNGGRYDQLRSSTEQLKVAQDKLAASPLFSAIGQMKTEIEIEALREITDVAKWVGNRLGVQGSDGLKTFDQNNAGTSGKGNTLTLAGQSAVDYKKLLRDAADANTEIALQHTDMEQSLFEKRRDYEEQIAEYRINLARKVQETELSNSRKMEDLAVDRAKLEQDQAFKTTEAKYALERQAAAREQVNKLNDAAQDFAIQKQYDAQKQSNSISDLRRDTSISVSDKKEDFYNRERDAIMSGGANGLSLLQMSRDAGIDIRRTQRNAAIKESDSNRDFTQGQAQDQLKFGINQGRSVRDFANKEGDTIASHQLDVDQHRYEISLQLAQAERETTRTMQDFQIAMNNILVDDQTQQRLFGNKGADLSFDENQTRTKQGFSDKKAGQSFTDQELSFATQLRQTINEDLLNKIAQNDPYIASLLDRQGNATKNPFGFQNSVGGASWGVNNNSPYYGGQDSGGASWGPSQYDTQRNSGGGQGQQMTYAPSHTANYPVTGAASQADVQKLHDLDYQRSQELDAVDKKYAALFREISPSSGIY